MKTFWKVCNFEQTLDCQCRMMFVIFVSRPRGRAVQANVPTRKSLGRFVLATTKERCATVDCSAIGGVTEKAVPSLQSTCCFPFVHLTSTDFPTDEIQLTNPVGMRGWRTDLLFQPTICQRWAGDFRLVAPDFLMMAVGGYLGGSFQRCVFRADILCGALARGSSGTSP